MGEKGTEFCPLCPALFKVEVDGMSMIGLVHGDDFMVEGTDAGLEWMDKVLNERYTYTEKWEAKLGSDEKDDKQLFFLNRLVRYVSDGTGSWKLEVEADARHAQILMKYFGFNERPKGVDTPEEKVRDVGIVEEEKSGLLEPGQT